VTQVNAAVAEDGVKQQELREWRYNLINSYTFNEGFLDGFTIGGVARWQDRVAIGNPLILTSEGSLVRDDNNPYYGENEFNADVWFAYNTKIGENIDWKIQLNIRNLIGGERGERYQSMLDQLEAWKASVDADLRASEARHSEN